PRGARRRGRGGRGGAGRNRPGSGNRLREDGGAQPGAARAPRRPGRPRLSRAGGRVAQGIHRPAARGPPAGRPAARHGRRPGPRGGGRGAPAARARRRRCARRGRGRRGHRARMKELFTSFRWQDGLDILVLSVVIYWGLNLIRGTRALPMLIGLGMVYAIYFLSNVFEVYTLNVLLRNLLGWSLVLVFIVFQDDIRRALTQVGTRPLFSPRERVAQGQAVEELIKALTYLAARRVGALVVLQTEERDAAAMVGAEEDGMISLVRQGKITRDVDAATLRTTLHRLLLA